MHLERGSDRNVAQYFSAEKYDFWRTAVSFLKLTLGFVNKSLRFKKTMNIFAVFFSEVSCAIFSGDLRRMRF